MEIKKKHIVVLVGSYYPNFSAVGICARNVVDELKKEADISVISQKTDINEKDEKKKERIRESLFPHIPVYQSYHSLFLLNRFQIHSI